MMTLMWLVSLLFVDRRAARPGRQPRGSAPWGPRSHRGGRGGPREGPPLLPLQPLPLDEQRGRQNCCCGASSMGAPPDPRVVGPYQDIAVDVIMDTALDTRTGCWCDNCVAGTLGPLKALLVLVTASTVLSSHVH